MPVGSIITESDYRPIIDEYQVNGQNYWEQAAKPYTDEFTKQYESATKVLEKDYSDAIKSAYEAYITNKRAAEFSNYGTGDVRNMIGAFEKSYGQARDQLYSKYLDKTNEQMQLYYQNMLSVQNMIDEQKNLLAKNYKSIFDTSYDYVSSLNASEMMSNPYFAKFITFDETGSPNWVGRSEFIDALSSVDDNGIRTLKSEDGWEQLFDYITSRSDYQDYMYDYNNELYTWMAENQGSNLAQMADVLGLDYSKFFNQGTDTIGTYEKTFTRDGQEVKMYDYYDIESKNTYKALDTGKYYVSGDNVTIGSGSRDESREYDLTSYDKEDLSGKITSILNYMSTGTYTPEKDAIKKGTLQIYNDKLYLYNGSKWVNMIDGKDKVSDVVKLLNDYNEGIITEERIQKVNEQNNPSYNSEMSNSIYKQDYDVPLIHVDANHHKFYAGSKPGTFAQIKTEYVKINNVKYWLKPASKDVGSDVRDKLKNDPYKVYKIGDKYYIYGTYNVGNAQGLFEIENFKG